MSVRNLSIKEYAKKLKSREFSVEEGVKEFIGAIKKEDKEINSYLSVFEDDAIFTAKEMDKKFERGENKSILCGVPIAVKDNILIHGTKTTAGSKILENYTASYDATVIQKLKNEDVVFLGKTNLDEFAMGASTENSAFGTVKNPYDKNRVPGGSSGGSAAAVSAYFAPVALGSDTGGSIRQPSAFCGVSGFKPTYGAVSRFGLISMASSLDQIGPIGKSVEDVSILFDAIEGRDNFDATSVGVSGVVPKDEILRKKVIGVPKEYFSLGVSPDIKEEVKKVIEKFERDGFVVKKVNLPHTKYALSTYYIIVPAEISANLARFEGIRYPKNLSSKKNVLEGDLLEKYLKARGYGFGDEVKRRILLGTFVLSAGYYDAYYKKATKVREIITNELKLVFEGVDFLITPTTPTRAFKIGEKTENPLEMYAADLLTCPLNLSGSPTLSVPVKKYSLGGNELPIGFQIIGKHFHDREVLGLGMYYEKYLR